MYNIYLAEKRQKEIEDRKKDEEKLKKYKEKYESKYNRIIS